MTSVPPGPCPAVLQIGRSSHAECRLLAGHTGLHTGKQRGAERLPALTWGERQPSPPGPPGPDLLTPAQAEEARQRLEGHEPVITLQGHQHPFVGCVCGTTNGRPFMWHVMDVIRGPHPEGARNV